MQKNLVPIKDAARILSMNPQTLYRMAGGGRLPAYKIGSAVRVSIEELLERFKVGDANGPE